MKYIIYEVKTNKNICVIDEFQHAFVLLYEFNNNNDGEKFDIKKIFE